MLVAVLAWAVGAVSFPVLAWPVLAWPVLAWPVLAWPVLAWPVLAWPVGSVVASVAGSVVVPPVVSGRRRAAPISSEAAERDVRVVQRELK